MGASGRLRKLRSLKMEENRILREMRGARRQRKFGVSILGTGALARAVAKSIVDLSESGGYHDYFDISKLFVVGRSAKRAKGIEMELSHAGSLTVKGRDYTQIEEVKAESDIMFILTDNHIANQPLIKQFLAGNAPRNIRDLLFKNNIGLMDDIVSYLNVGDPFKGTIVPGTNQPDRFCYYLSQGLDGVDPRQIAGLDHTDTVRLHTFLEKYLKGNVGIDYRQYQEMLHLVAYTIGEHGDSMVPALSNVDLVGMDLKNFAFFKKAMDEIRQEVIDAGINELKHLGQSPVEAAVQGAMCILESIILEETPSVVSTFVDFQEMLFTTDPNRESCKNLNLIPKKPIHIGLPCYFRDFKTELVPQGGPEEERERQLDWFWKLDFSIDSKGRAVGDKADFFRSAKILEGEINGALDNGFVVEEKGTKKVFPVRQIAKKSDYNFERLEELGSEYPPIDLDTIVFTECLNPKKAEGSDDPKTKKAPDNSGTINMYKLGFKLTPIKQFIYRASELPGSSEARPGGQKAKWGISTFTASNNQLCAIVKSRGRSGEKEMSRVVVWDIQTGNLKQEYDITDRNLNSITLEGKNVVCGINGKTTEAAIRYLPNGDHSIIRAGSDMELVSLASDGINVYGSGEKGIYLLEGEKCELVQSGLTGGLSSIKAVNTKDGRVIVGKNKRGGEVYVLNPDNPKKVVQYDSDMGIFDLTTDEEGDILLATIDEGTLILRKYETVKKMLRDAPVETESAEGFVNSHSIRINTDYVIVADHSNRLHAAEIGGLRRHDKPMELSEAEMLHNVWVIQRW
jgi:malate/lactate dehydrogenase